MSGATRILLATLFLGPNFGCGPAEDDPRAGGREPRSAAETASTIQTALGPEAYGQLIYVPAYSHIYHLRQETHFQLTITLSIRNPHPWRVLTINRADYFNSAGHFVRSYLNKPLRLQPLQTLEYVVAQDDVKGGSGASSLVGWDGEPGVAGPVTEAVMIGTSAGQGLSFTTRGWTVPAD